MAIRYDKRCYFNVRSKADTGQLDLPHGANDYKVETEKVKSKIRICSEVLVNSPGNPRSQSGKCFKSQDCTTQDWIGSNDPLK